MADDPNRVRGMAEDAKMAAEGLKLMGKEEAEFDSDAAAKYKDEIDATIAKLTEESAALTGKDNKKARTEKDKEIKAVKDDKKYIDACKVGKGLPAPNGNFLKKAGGASAAAKEAEDKAKADEAAAAKAKEDASSKKDKPKKEQESAGISKAERDELEKIKTDIIARKTQLKAEGMSGGQQNKDEQVAAMVARMNVLKEKENPSFATDAKSEKKAGKKKAKSGENEAAIEELNKEIEEYRQKLATEWKYSKKEITADPDMMDLMAKLKTLSK